jgi:Flp pilus assembly protein TadG
VATVEFAFVVPILFTVFMGAIEFARLNQVKNATAYAAYEGCRRAIVPGATAANATTAAQAILTAGLIKGSGTTITINPTTITNSTDTVTVTVAVPMNTNSWTKAVFGKNLTITRSCTLTREKTDG